ncbi:hypothetical protein DFH06DRAFT_1089891 [Mycena polygramma]|nr:hypothetical protein DFH06DRAFT_1089891 [Mycena polygramma]
MAITVGEAVLKPFSLARTPQLLPSRLLFMSCPNFEVDTTFGAFLIGTLVSYALFGVVTVQVYIYYDRFPQDSRTMKAMVAALWCGELAHTVSIASALYTMIITNFGHPEHLIVLPTSLPVAAFVGSLVAFGVQSFFAFRIYRLSRSLWIPCLCWALSLFRLVPSNVILFAFGVTDPAAEIISRWGSLFDALWAASAVNDIIIAVSLVYSLYHHRSSASERTAAIVDKLIAWTIETGLVTSVASIVLMSVFITMPTNFVWLSIFVIIPRLFSNSFLASLNSRAALRTVNSGARVSHTTRSTPAITSLPRSGSSNPVNLSIEMNKVTMTTYDE